MLNLLLIASLSFKFNGFNSNPKLSVSKPHCEHVKKAAEITSKTNVNFMVAVYTIQDLNCEYCG